MTDHADKFTVQPDGAVLTQCVYCARFAADGRCGPFPDGIPPEVFDNEFDHRRVHPDQPGAGVFVPRDGVPDVVLGNLYDTLDELHHRGRP